MTPERMRVKIAEACGITVGECSCADNPHIDVATRKHLQNYPGDLNACHEMENHAYKHQPSGWLTKYNDAIYEVCSRAQYPSWNPICSTAPQRCEAFLRTLGLWEEGDEP